MRLDAAVGRRALLLAATALTAPRITPAAEVTSLDGLTQGLGSLRQPYCVPGVTAKRCRGTFWETGQLYKKDESVQLLSPEEYTTALASLDRLGGSLREVRKLASTPGGEAYFVFKKLPAGGLDSWLTERRLPVEGGTVVGQ